MSISLLGPLWGCVFVVGAPWGAASVLLGQSYFQAGTAWHQWQGETLASATAKRQIKSARGQLCGDPLWHLHDMTGSHHLFGTSRGHRISWKCSEISGTVGKPLMLWVALPRTGRVQPGLLGRTGVLTHCWSPRIGPRWLGHLKVDIDPGRWGWTQPWVKVTLRLAPEACSSQPALPGGSGPPASPVSPVNNGHWAV